jgi:Tfp pilus assembly protein PilF
LQKAVEIDPDLPEANGNLALILMKEKNFDDAEACLEVILRQYPADIGANFNLAVIKAYQGDIEGAKERFRRVLSLDPGNVQAQRNLQILENGVPPR